MIVPTVNSSLICNISVETPDPGVSYTNYRKSGKKTPNLGVSTIKITTHQIQTERFGKPTKQSIPNTEEMIDIVYCADSEINYLEAK
ncbi:MAG: hypothetical protein COT43_05185 [Candidatus Marinimicrobia bacterium CG08_land_8_20_14_0_20_45_22]|nr:MAG: hypothetical protein COT43_05185 [Candidatus Marinimicrobia bacterium CG08_land_8_20_14_0_20_45_22]